MIACVDVDYRAAEAITACVGIRNWPDTIPCVEHIARTTETIDPYIPGQFYLREMPLILRILEGMTDVELIVVDGYVWLAKDRPGLGAHVYENLVHQIPVVGVAKGPFHNNDIAIPVMRGGSTRPLYVTSVGIDVGLAAGCIARMAGQHRMPTILRRVDLLARGVHSIAK